MRFWSSRLKVTHEPLSEPSELISAMANTNKPSGLPPKASETGSHGFERVVIKWFNSSKGFGFLNLDGGLDVAFTVDEALRSTSASLIGDVAGTEEPLLVRFSPDRKRLTEIRRATSGKAQAKDHDPKAQSAPELTATDYEAAKNLALEALRKASGERRVEGDKSLAAPDDPSKHKLLPRMPRPKFVFDSGQKDRALNSLYDYFQQKSLPPSMWAAAAADIERIVGMKLAASIKRPLWDDRANYPELANLTAPEFLKQVWADQIAIDGTIEKELVRQIDRSLMGKVDNYIATREKRGQDAGDAEGLRFITRKTRPKSERPLSAHAPKQEASALATSCAAAFAVGLGIAPDAFASGGAYIALPFVVAAVVAILLSAGWHIALGYAAHAREAHEKAISFGFGVVLFLVGVGCSGWFMASMLGGNAALQAHHQAYLDRLTAAMNVAAANGASERNILSALESAAGNLDKTANAEGSTGIVSGKVGQKVVYTALKNAAASLAAMRATLGSKGDERDDLLAKARDDIREAFKASAAHNASIFEESTSNAANAISAANAIRFAPSLTGIGNGLAPTHARPVIDEAVGNLQAAAIVI
eukprot:gene13049-13150_t